MHCMYSIPMYIMHAYILCSCIACTLWLCIAWITCTLHSSITYTSCSCIARSHTLHVLDIHALHVLYAHALNVLFTHVLHERVYKYCMYKSVVNMQCMGTCNAWVAYSCIVCSVCYHALNLLWNTIFPFNISLEYIILTCSNVRNFVDNFTFFIPPPPKKIITRIVRCRCHSWHIRKSDSTQYPYKNNLHSHRNNQIKD